MKILFPLIIVSCFLFNCDSTEPVEPTQPNQPIQPVFSDTLFYLALGDSYTIGESVSVNERYPVQLGDSLFPQDTIDVKIIAGTGWTTSDLQEEIGYDNDLRSRYDLVSLLIGVNNQYQGESLETYKVEFRALLEKSISLAGNNRNKVFVVSIPDYAYTPFGNGSTTISQEIDDFNAASKAIVDELGVQYFDITPISREGLNDTELVASDGLHPSGKQYTQWVELMLEDVRTIIE